MVRKFVLPIVVSTILAVATSADAAQRNRGGGGGGGGGRAVRSGPSQGQAVPRAAAPVRGPYGGGGYYRGYGNRPYSGYPYYRGSYPYYYRGYYPYYRAYPYYYPGFSIGFGFGFPFGYSSFYYGYPYSSYSYPYAYPYAYPNAYPSAGYAYPAASSSAYPPPNTAYPGTSSSYPRSDVTVTTVGRVTLQITPGTAEVYADGDLVGVVDDFSPSTPGLTLPPGRHHIEVRAPGYATMIMDTDVVAGQVVPYRGSLRSLRAQ